MRNNPPTKLRKVKIKFQKRKEKQAIALLKPEIAKAISGD